MKKLYTLLLSAIAFTGLNAQTIYIDDLFSTVSVQKDIQYGTSLTASSQPVNLFLDVYTPDGDTRTNRAVLVMAHQGSFLPEYGDKSDQYLEDYANAMAKKGFVVVAMNYREGWGFSPVNSAEQNARAILPAAWRGIQDYKTAIRFLRKSIAEDGNPYGIRSELIFGGGFGAGGYLPLNAGFIDLPSELVIPELQQKGIFGAPNGTPYIDSTKADLGGIANLNGSHAAYSFEVPLVINISGATPTLKLLENGKNPKVISVHSDEDQATPYRTDVVRAAGVFPVIEVSGSYDIHAKLKSLSQNQDFVNETRDGYTQIRATEDTPGDNAYKQGLLTFVGQPYMWSVNDEDTYSPDYQASFTQYMDSIVSFTSYRIESVINDLLTGINDKGNLDINVSIYPNPAKGFVFIENKGSHQFTEIGIYNIAGKLVKNITGLEENKVNIADLNSGMYYIKMKVNGGEKVHKLIIQ